MKHGKLTRRLQRKVRRVISGGTTRLLKPEIIEAEIAPDEMPVSSDDPFNLSVPDNDASGVLRLGKSSHLPTALAEASEHNEHGWLPGLMVTTITLMAVLFIAIITWFISQMPGK
ncbi:MAG: hypothetical protein ABIP14_05340 [Blastocatellia bacterium]